MPLPESGSDGENGEKPVRERLKQTTIDKTTVTSNKSEGTDAVQEEAENIAPVATDDMTSVTKTPHNSAPRKSEDDGHLDSSTASAKPGGKADASEVNTRKRTREDQAAENEPEGTRPHRENGATDAKMPPARGLTPPQTANTSRLEAMLTSPRKKRSRESLGVDEDVRHQKIPSTEGTRARRSSSEERQDDTATGGDNDAERDKRHSTQSPIFGEALKPKVGRKPADKPQTSSSAFAASGFASLSGSASPFQSLDASDGKGKPTEAPSQQTTSSFASAAVQSNAFGSATKPTTFGSSFSGGRSSFAAGSSSAVSGFGTLGSQTFGGGSGGFGATGFGSGAPLSSFAAPVGDVKLGASKAEKPFGAPEESDPESEADSESEEGTNRDEALPKDRKEEEALSPKFQVQEVQTGEDDEDSIYTNRAKLFQYHADSSSWKERGVGPIKVNVKRTTPTAPAEADLGEGESKPEESKTHVQARFVMRNHATHKVILNAPVYKEMKVDEQSAKQLLFVCPNETGSMTTYMLRMGKEDDIKHLHRVINDLQGKM